jgi:hypothetical protein
MSANIALRCRMGNNRRNRVIGEKSVLRHQFFALLGVFNKQDGGVSGFGH